MEWLYHRHHHESSSSQWEKSRDRSEYAYYWHVCAILCSGGIRQQTDGTVRNIGTDRPSECIGSRHVRGRRHVRAGMSPFVRPWGGRGNACRRCSSGGALARQNSPRPAVPINKQKQGGRNTEDDWSSIACFARFWGVRSYHCVVDVTLQLKALAGNGPRKAIGDFPCTRAP